MVKNSKPCHHAAWTQKKHDKREKAGLTFLIPKLLNVYN